MQTYINHNRSLCLPVCLSVYLNHVSLKSLLAAKWLWWKHSLPYLGFRWKLCYHVWNFIESLTGLYTLYVIDFCFQRKFCCLCLYTYTVFTKTTYPCCCSCRFTSWTIQFEVRSSRLWSVVWRRYKQLSLGAALHGLFPVAQSWDL